MYYDTLGFVVDEKNSFVVTMGSYPVEVSLDEVFGCRSKLGYGIVMMDDGPNKFIGAGNGLWVRFLPTTKPSNTIIARGLNGDEVD